jgi:hypothetical protein
MSVVVVVVIKSANTRDMKAAKDTLDSVITKAIKATESVS